MRAIWNAFIGWLRGDHDRAYMALCAKREECCAAINQWRAALAVRDAETMRRLKAEQDRLYEEWCQMAEDYEKRYLGGQA